MDRFRRGDEDKGEEGNGQGEEGKRGMGKGEWERGNGKRGIDTVHPFPLTPSPLSLFPFFSYQKTITAKNAKIPQRGASNATEEILRLSLATFALCGVTSFEPWLFMFEC